MPYWLAFHTLVDQREMGGMGGSGALRREAVTDYLNEMAILDPVERDRFRFYLNAMDGEFMDAQKKAVEKEAQQIPKVGKGN